MAKATIRDVAREAKVSTASVSRVLNEQDGVRSNVRARVLDAVELLDYVRHAGARNLSRARSDTLGVVLPDLHGEFFSEILRGMDAEASVRGLHLLLSTFGKGPDGGRDALHTLRGCVDGLIVMAPEAAPGRLGALLAASMPTVLINCAETSLGRSDIRVDNAGAAEVMTRHLLGTGRERVVHLAGPQTNVEARERVEGYRRAMAQAGRAPRVIVGDFTETAGADAVAELLRDSDRADALFAANDVMAIGALLALRRAGIDVPGDMAVAGFDDVPLARLVTPDLTTMRVDMAALGARAVARLVDAIGGADATSEMRLPQLVVRGTTQTSKIKNRETGRRTR